jgi:mono/diheme cytochrome c family protein
MNRFAAISLGTLALAAIAVPAASAFATAANPSDKLGDEQVAKGRQLFQDNSCNACHTLADGNGAGSIGPALDGNKNLTHELIVDRVTNGSGPMPSFGGQIPDTDIDLLAKYILQVKK